MLLGREAELARIDAALDEARRGRSYTLVIRGEPGIGKTSLLRAAAERADSFVKLTARGIQSESTIAFSGLADLFRPVVEKTEELPPPQAFALRGALGLGPPMPSDRFMICAAVLAAIGSAGDDAPVAVLVDDLQWLDDPSAEALLFAARRLQAEGVTMVFTVREGEADALDIEDLDELPLRGLNDDAARELLGRRSRSGTPIASDVADRLVETSGGNPLALSELPAILDNRQLSGEEPLEDPLPLGQRLERALLHRVEPLPEETRRGLVVAAASDTGAVDEIRRGLAALGINSDVLEIAEDAGVVKLTDGHLVFAHPLLRSAVYHSQPPPWRRKVHRALAESVSQQARRAWHLAAATAEPDEEVAAALHEAAVDARNRSGYATAAATFAKSARLTPDEGVRPVRLLEAGLSAHLGGRSRRALELLEEALGYDPDPELRAEIQHLRGIIQTLSGVSFEAPAMLMEEAERIGEIAPDKASLMMTDATFACQLTARVNLGVSAARRALNLAQAGLSKALAGLALGIGLILQGEPAAAITLLDENRHVLESGDPAVAIRGMHTSIGHAYEWVDRYEDAETILAQTVSLARSFGAPAPLPYALAASCEVHYRTGDWVGARAEGLESMQLGEQTGQEPMVAAALVTLGRLDAAQGRSDDANATARRVLEITDRLRTESLRVYVAAFLGLLELGLDNMNAAVDHLLQTRELARASGLRHPGVVRFGGDLVEALLLAGQTGEARDALQELEAQATSTGSEWAAAAAARGRGLMEEAFSPHFERAIEHHDGSGDPFDRARTLLRYGERLRRANQRAEARGPLRSALEIFERLEADPWSAKARGELAATGERVRPRTEVASQTLTPQELQVARVVAQGATNREAASSLFLSAKTIEFHLSNVYAKLGLRSRSELAAFMAAGGPFESQPEPAAGT
jgi:DNA-binding CsgD family transcriptional regulator